MKDQWGSKNSMYCHGKFGTRIHKIWDGMIQRCHNPKSRDFKNWGARGITVSDRWRRFENFYADMGDAPTDRSLDRIDNNKGYSKENCRWATWKMQHRNRRNNRFLEYRGQSKTMAEWIEITGIKKATFEWRIHNGWSVEKTIETTPSNKWRPKCQT